MDRECLSVVSVRYKTRSDHEKVKKRVHKKLNRILTNPSPEDGRKYVKLFPELKAEDIRTVTTSSTYIVVLLRSGRVCRFELTSSSKPSGQRLIVGGPQTSERTKSLQVQSDEQYAKRLQALYNLEQEGRGLLGSRLPQDHSLFQDLVVPSFSPPSSPTSPLYPSTWYPGLMAEESSFSLSMPFPFPIYSTSPTSTPLTIPSFERLDSGVSPDFLDSEVRSMDGSKSAPVSSKEAEKQSKGKFPQSRIPSSNHSTQGTSNGSTGNTEEGKAGEQDSNWPTFGRLEWLERVELESGVGGDVPLFCDVAATHSEILLVTESSRALYCWPCGSGKNGDTPPASPHPLAYELKLSHGGIRLIKSSHIRTTVVMDSGDIATFYDPLLRDCTSTGPPSLIADLSHPASPLLASSEHITSLSVGDFLTVAITESGKAYWWGLLSQGDSTTNSSSTDTSSAAKLKLGSTVRLKDGPKYGGGTAIFRHHPQYGPQIGLTVDQMDHSPTMDPTSILVKVYQSLPSASDPSVQHLQNSQGDGVYLDKWNSTQVTLLEDSTPILGKLIVIDNGQAIVEVSPKEGATDTEGENPPGSSHLKVFKVSDLQMVSGMVDPVVGAGPDTSQPSQSTQKPATKQLVGCKQHATGIVQKAPVCFVNAADDGSSELLFDVTASFGESVIFGFRPLSAHFVEDKPMVLLERLSDGNTFLLLSSKSSGALLRPSSFVSIGSSKASPPKCTVEEESIMCRDSGLVCDSPRDSVDLCFDLEVEEPLQKTSSSPSSRLKERKRTPCEEPLGKENGALPRTESRKPLICSNFYGSVLLVQDTVGGVHLLNNGLSLKSCVTSSFKCAYTAVCVEERVIDSYYSTMLFVLVPAPRCLLDSVLAGNKESVITAVREISDSVSQMRTFRSSRKGKYKVNDVGAKRRKVSSKTNSDSFSYDNGNNASSMTKDDIVNRISPLLSRTIGNQNICHLCCHGDEEQKEGQNTAEECNSKNPVKTGEAPSKGSAFKNLRKKSKWTPPDHRTTISQCRLQILNFLLDCKESTMKTVVLHLLCSKNSKGCTPFMHALSHGNHEAALSILKYILEEDQRNRNSLLLQKAVLHRNISGMTPLQLFIQGILPSGFPYDTHRKRLHVYNLPPGVTAQQLMDLFKSYYPSVYRVEVKGEDAFRGNEVDSDTSDSDQDGDPSLARDHDVDNELLNRFTNPLRRSFGPSPTNPYGIISQPADRERGSGLTRRQLRSRRSRRMQDMEGSHVALVYFSDLHQMRSAAVEMDKHRISVNNSSRGTSFGATINVRAIEVEVEAYACEGPSEPMSDWVQLKPRGLNINFEEEKKKCRTTGPATESLLSMMLETAEICSMKDENGETAICSLIHNKAAVKLLCLEVKADQNKDDKGGDSKKGKDEADKQHCMMEILRTLQGERLSSLQDMDGYLRSMAQSLGIVPPIGTVFRSGTSPPHSFTDSLPSTTHDEGATSTSDSTVAGGKKSTEEESSLNPPPSTMPLFPSSTTTPTVPSPLTLSVTSSSNQGTSPSPTRGAAEKGDQLKTSQDNTLKYTSSDISDYVVLDSGDLVSNEKSSNCEGEGKVEDMDDSSGKCDKNVGESENDGASSSSTHKQFSDSSSQGSNELVGLVERLFSNWPCILATVLGYFPTCMSRSKNSPQKTRGQNTTAGDVPHLLEAGHVAQLDDFVQVLLYSGHSALMNQFIKTVIERMNASTATNVSEIFAKILKNDRVTLSEENLGIVVGCVLLRSLVRLVVVEHSRPNGITSVANISPEPVPSNEYLGPAGSRRSSHNSQKQILEVYEKLKLILEAFGALSLLAMATACEGIMAPVRVGLTKPLGASSVCAEYQRGSSSRTTSYYRPMSERGGHEQSQSSHPRTHLRSSTLYRVRDASLLSLPQEGFRLRPKLSMSGGVSDDVMDETLGEEGGDEEWPMIESSGPSANSHGVYPRIPSLHRVSMHMSNLIDEELSILDNSDSSDSDDSMLLIQDVLDQTRQTGNENGDQGSQPSVYEYAWALDGRILGETFRGSTHAHVDMFDPYMDTKLTSVTSIPSIRFGAAFLTRTHTRLLKDLVDLATRLGKRGKTSTKDDITLPVVSLPVVNLPSGLNTTVVRSIFEVLEPSWQWVCQLLDIAEGQLHRGVNFDTEHFVYALRGTTRNGTQLPSSSLSRTSSTQTGGIIGSSPAEYVTYLLRAHTHESQGVLPVLDLYGYEHVVYTLDGFMYLLAKWPKEFSIASNPSPQEGTRELPDVSHSLVQTQSTGTNSLNEDASVNSPSESFFRRSLSLFEAAPPKTSGMEHSDYSETSFNRSVSEELPLADQPHLLRLRLEGSSTPKRPPTRSTSTELPVSLSSVGSPVHCKMLSQHSVDEVVQRWQTAINVFAHVFLVEGPGSERNNFLYAHAGVASRMARFRHQLSVLRENTVSAREFGPSSSTLSVRVRRTNLLQDGLDLLKNMTNFRYQQVRVKFDGEDGSGPGVNRGFFTTFANALKTSDKTKGGKLLHEPGKLPEQTGLYAPCPHQNQSSKKDKEERRLNFVAIGRFLGLCLWFRQTIPLMISRHVTKFLLGRELAWHDLAFFNSNLYEGLRRMLLDAQEKRLSLEEFKCTYCCYFEAPFGDTSVELIPGGRKIPVTPDKVKEYVHLYSMYAMVDCVKDEMSALKTGLHDIIPSELLSGITAEDFQLLLSGGCENISLSKLKSCLRFHHSHSGSRSIAQRFEKMFWKVVAQMTNSQRQQLLYFATGSSAMPVQNDGGIHGMQITVEVMGTNLESLPIASTCSQRISLPLYPSIHILRRKLYQAIQCQGYGLA